MGQNEAREPGERDEVNRPHRLTVEQPAEPSQRIGDGRALHQAGGDRDRRGDEQGDEIAELLEAVVAGPTMIDGKVQRRILDRRRERGREHFPGQGHEPPPLIGREQQGIKGDAVDQPQQVDREMPPSCETNGVTEARNAEPGRQGDGVVLGGPDAALRHRNLETEPICSGCTVSPPIEPWVIGQDLEAGPHDEQHEEHVQEVLELQPPGEARVDRRRGLRDAGMLLDEGRHAGKLAQALSQSDQAEKRSGSDGEAPQGVYPAPANPNPWGDSLLRGVETQAIVRIAEAGAERLGRGRLRECGHRAIAFCRRSRLAMASIAKLCERRALVEGNMVGLGALDLILRNVGVCVMGIAV